MFLKVSSAKQARHLAIAAACAIALAFGVLVPALATSQAGPLYVYDTADAYAIEGYTTANSGIGVEGYAALASATGVTGVLGYTLSQYSTGVTGYSDGTGTSYGVYGYSTNGNGVYGKSLSSSAASIYGLNANGGTSIYGYSNGLGLYGVSTGTNGVVGATQTTDDSSTGKHYAGVLGNDNSTAGQHYGVAGMTGNGGGYGVFGLSTGTGLYSQGIGVVGKSSGYGPGVKGSSSGSGDGVRGTAGNDPTAAGVHGDSGQNLTSPGVLGESFNGSGVFGRAGGGPGAGGANGGAAGVQGRTYGPSGIGVYAVSNEANSIALRVYVNPGTPIVVANQTNDVMTLDASGNMVLRGSLTQNGTPLSVVRNPQGGGRVVYAAQQAEPTIEDNGEAQMVKGRAYVQLDPAFADVLQPGVSYSVFITPEGNTAGVFVTQKSPAGFAVRENGNGQSTVAFAYRIVARPASERRLSRLAAYREPQRYPYHDKAVPRMPMTAMDRETPAHGVTLGHLPQRLKTPFVPKPQQRR